LQKFWLIGVALFYIFENGRMAHKARVLEIASKLSKKLQTL